MHAPRFIAQGPAAPLQAGLCIGLAVLGLLGGCESLPSGQPGADVRYTETRARRLERAGRHAQAAELYEQLAEMGAEPDESWLRAAAQWHAAGEWSSVQRALAGIQGPLPANLAHQQALLGASAALYLQESSSAQRWLAQLPEPPPDKLRPSLLWLQVRLALLSGDIRGAIELNNEREIWLAQPEDVRSGRQALLEALSQDKILAAQPAPDPSDSEYAGWIALARIVAGADRDPFAVRSALRKWQEAHPGHPADLLLPDLLQDYRKLLDFPQRLAVLLPASGRLGAAGEAVRDGLLAAYLRQEEARPALHFYDTHDRDVTAVYNQAVLDGADFVIGPLTRSDVDTLSALPQLPVPVLALNNLSDPKPVPGIYQFGLSPEDEARQAARRILAEGLVQGIALVPATNWGDRVLSAFNQELEIAGGMLLDYQQYDPDEEDFSGPITTVLHLAESRDRYRAIAGVLGRRLEFEPRRRQDVQFIFLAATAETGRLMRPQLRFHYASGLPVYATSAIYSPDPGRNGDLNGIHFVDVPLLLDETPELAALREDLTRLFPARMRAWPRLHALGFDAYRLVPSLFSGKMLEETSIAGLTGELSMGMDGQVRRELLWARFENGVPALLGTPDLTGQPVGEPGLDESL